jgi:magnesium chelatase family protein
VRERVAFARRRQAARRAGPIATNAALPDAGLERVVRAAPEARALLGDAVERLGLSARSVRRALRVARTIADLAGERGVGAEHVAEAVGYRDPRQPR